MMRPKRKRCLPEGHVLNSSVAEIDLSFIMWVYPYIDNLEDYYEEIGKNFELSLVLMGEYDNVEKRGK